MNVLWGEVKLISAKVLTKDLINKYSILYGAKYCLEHRSQSYFIFEPVFKYIGKS